MEYYIILMIVYVILLVEALFRTFYKEKTMIQETGETLPTSSYVFLVLHYVFMILGFWIWGQLPLTLPQGFWGQVGFLLLVIVVTTLLASTLETLIRVIAIQIHYQNKKKELDNE